MWRQWQLRHLNGDQRAMHAHQSTPIALASNASNGLLAMLKPCLKLLFTLLLATLALCHTAAFAAEPAIVIDDQFTQRAIGLDIDIYEDKTAQLSLEDIRSPEVSDKFISSTNENPNFHYTNSAYWARFSLLDNRSSEKLKKLTIYLTLAYAPTDFTELWCANINGNVIINQKSGDHVPLSDWPNTYRFPTFEISSLAHTCWLKLITSDSLQIPLSLTQQDVFIKNRITDSAVQALYFGALLVMIVYNTLIAVVTRSWAYGSYTLFLVGFGLHQISFNGIGYQLLWPNTTGWSDKAALIGLGSAAFFSTLFAILLLDLRRLAPKLYKFGLIVQSLFFIFLFLYLFLSYFILIQISIFLVFPWAIFLILSGIYLSWKKVRVAKIYLTAWMFFVMGVLIFSFRVAGILPTNTFTANAIQIGSAIEFILLSFALADRLKTMQKSLLAAQIKIAEGLRLSEQDLTQKVEQRTSELKTANQIAEQERDVAMTAKALAEREHQQAVAAKLEADAAKVQAEQQRHAAEVAKELAETQRQQAETARHQTAEALDELKATQTQLIAAEKMASLGLLVSNVAHEINTPIGAVKSSGTLISDTLDSALPDLSELFAMLDDTHRALFVQMITQCKQSTAKISTREERGLTKQITAQLQEAGVEDASRNARLLMKLRAHQNPLEYLPLLQHPDNEFILDTAGNMANIINGTSNINSAVEKVSRVVYALKALSGDDVVKAAIVAPLQPDMDNALAKYQSQMKSVELVTNFQPDMPPIHADHDALEQLCIHLVMNALQAMNYEGKLTVGLSAEKNQAIISVTDTGSGIADDIKDRIFEPFFTTRTSGEGSGMGLAIVKRIVEQHQGKIEVKTEVGVGTTFAVTLPYAQMID